MSVPDPSGRARVEHPRTEWRGGEHSDRHTQLRIVVVFALIFILLAAVAVGIALLKAPPAVKPPCSHPGCAAPPRAPSPSGIGTTGALAPASGRTLHAATGGGAAAIPATANAAPAYSSGAATYTSPGLGFSFEYPNGLTVGQSSGNQVVLVNGSNPDFIVYVLGAPVSSASPSDVRNVILQDLGQQIPNLAEVSPSSALSIPAVELGGHVGVGGFYQGYRDTPNGPQTPVDLAVLAASDGRQSLGVAVESLNQSATQSRMGTVDQTILDSFRFQGDIVR
ncbi:MAG TPA: hypothetical protein VFN55_15835 [Solirubrobacteraceae bacterium]|nr:hypothetical protein [Solirubrobacteraceae bacterium]